jgi:hypothetical protein
MLNCRGSHKLEASLGVKRYQLFMADQEDSVVFPRGLLSRNELFQHSRRYALSSKALLDHHAMDADGTAVRDVLRHGIMCKS